MDEKLYQLVDENAVGTQLLVGILHKSLGVGDVASNGPDAPDICEMLSYVRVAAASMSAAAKIALKLNNA